MYIVTPLWPVTSQYSDTFYPSGLGQCALIEFARRLPLTSCHVGRFFYSIDPRDSHHLRRERVSIRSLVDLPPTTKRSDSVQRTVRARDVANSQVLSTGERAYDLLRGAAAAVAAVALDPGDDGVRLRAALRARAQDVLHRLPDSNGFEWAQHSTAARQTRTEKEESSRSSRDHVRTARNLSVCDGTTRSSWSAVSSMVGGYWPPRQLGLPLAAAAAAHFSFSSHGRRTLWRGEYLHEA